MLGALSMFGGGGGGGVSTKIGDARSSASQDIGGVRFGDNFVGKGAGNLPLPLIIGVAVVVLVLGVVWLRRK